MKICHCTLTNTIACKTCPNGIEGNDNIKMTYVPPGYTQDWDKLQLWNEPPLLKKGWEYKDFIADNASLDIHQLKKLGSDGWEVCGVLGPKSYLLKRAL